MSRLSEDTKLEILNDHYKETVSDFKKTGKSRDWNFAAVLLLLGIMIFQFVSPSQSQSLLTQIINSRLEIDAAYGINLLGSLVWLAMLFVLIRYFQAVINLEKQYNYSHKLETLLSDSYGNRAFTREGESYLENYPIYSEWLHLIYRKFFPIFLIVVLTIKLVAEWLAFKTPNLPVVVDTVVYLGLIVSIILFIYSLHKADKDSAKDLN